MTRRLWTIIGASTALVLVIVLAVVLTQGGHKHKTTGASTSASTTAATSASGPPTSTGAPAPISSLVPAKGVLFGAWAASTDYTQQGRINAVTKLDSDVGVNLPIVHIYRKLDDPIGSKSDLAAISANKKLLISWAGTDTKLMASGQEDAVIRQRAQEVAALKVPVYFEYRWEMDRPNLASVVHSPADFIAAWDHVRAIFKAEHVTNAAFVWCPLANGFAPNRAQPYYPGDDEVDWICADLYPAYPHLDSFATLAKPFLSWAAGHDKPIMFGEFGITDHYADQRAQWLTDIGPVLTANPRIKALVYFNSGAGSPGHNFSLTAGSAPAKAFAALATSFAPPK